jgi:septal ring factor EnvC (AmiA/AmiB activator)
MKLPRISKLFIFAFLIPMLIGLAAFSLAQTPQEERASLEKELADLEKQISQYESDITQTQQQKKTLQNQISILKKKIQQLDLQIKQSNAMIKDIGYQITDTASSITKTSSKIDETKNNLADILTVIYQEDQKSLVEVLVSSAQISDFFGDVETLQNLNTKSRELLATIRDLKVSLETEKVSLDTEKENLQKVAQIQALQKATSMNTKTEQEKLLEQTKGKESEYQKLLSATQKRAADIRARIFELIGVTKAPTFEEAY